MYLHSSVARISLYISLCFPLNDRCQQNLLHPHFLQEVYHSLFHSAASWMVWPVIVLVLSPQLDFFYQSWLPGQRKGRPRINGGRVGSLQGWSGVKDTVQDISVKSECREVQWGYEEHS